MNVNPDDVNRKNRKPNQLNAIEGNRIIEIRLSNAIEFQSNITAISRFDCDSIEIRLPNAIELIKFYRHFYIRLRSIDSIAFDYVRLRSIDSIGFE